MSAQTVLPPDFVTTVHELIQDVKTLRRALRETEAERDVAIDNLGRVVLENVELRQRIARLSGEVQ